MRFGSTETCLQVVGTPLPSCVGGAALAPFERGWAHAFKGHPSCGYYIGRPHPPHTEARVVRGVTPGAPGYLEFCEEGEPGQLVCRGGFLMSGYVGDEAATARAIPTDADAGGWYINLGDVCFTLRAADGEATLCVRGYNPTCEQLQPCANPVQSDVEIVRTTSQVATTSTGSHATRHYSFAAAPTTHTSRSTASSHFGRR